MKTTHQHSIFNNLRFLIAEVSLQLNGLEQAVTTEQNNPLFHLDRLNYVLNLKTSIQNACHQRLIKLNKNDQEVIFLRTMESIAMQLQGVAELCIECFQSPQGLTELLQQNQTQLFPHLQQCIGYVEPSITHYDIDDALNLLNQAEQARLICQQTHDQYVASLKHKHTDSDLIVSVLFTNKCFSSMCERMCKIAEAIISTITGQSLNLNRYTTFSELISRLQKNHPDKNFSVQNLADTKSGSNISRVVETHNNDVIAVLKDGKKRKLKEERQGVESWHEIYPGIAPRVLDYRKQGSSAALLIEHLSGDTIENIVLHGTDTLIDQAISELLNTLQAVWVKTRKEKNIDARFMQQLHKRLDDVYAIHPQFVQQSCTIAGVKMASYEQLVQQASALEEKLSPPFSVYIHGDFNSDNIIYDPELNKINFIDLHRSKYMDYLQDISVFMVSNYRLQSLDKVFRKRVQWINLRLYNFAANFADSHDDTHFEVRLALGLARSFATSTRYVLDTGLSRAMFYRSRYLLEQVCRLKNKQLASYKVPITELFLG